MHSHHEKCRLRFCLVPDLGGRLTSHYRNPDQFVSSLVFVNSHDYFHLARIAGRAGLSLTEAAVPL